MAVRNDITLANLASMSKQDVFDTVAQHLLLQGKRSAKGGQCLYRGPGGLKCAVGKLIADDEYDMAKMECRPFSYFTPGAGTMNSLAVLSELRDMHDTVHPERWANRMRKIARQHGLSADVVNYTVVPAHAEQAISKGV